jgi:glycosyltransferase involved in cell wall biosynthesis
VKSSILVEFLRLLGSCIVPFHKIRAMKAIAIVPCYNCAPVLEKTIAAIPRNTFDSILIVDDGSSDGTSDVAQRLGLQVVRHPQNRGYGGAQKTGYGEAIRRGYDGAVLIHGDNQYDPSASPQFVKKLCEGFDVVTGSRMILGDALKNGMPLWKFAPNRLLTWLENFVFRTSISDYHNGYRAFSVSFLRQVPLEMLSDKFDFDTDIMVQAAIRKARIVEIPHVTRYDEENSQMPFSKGVVYGLSILRTVGSFLLHRSGMRRSPLFEVGQP